MKKLFIYFEQDKVGEFCQDDNLIHSIKYDTSWLVNPRRFPLSFAMPLREKENGNKLALSFVENLLPEGEIKKSLKDQYKIGDDFDFLRKFGNDCAGAIIFLETDVPPKISLSNRKIQVAVEDITKAVEEKKNLAQVIARKNNGYIYRNLVAHEYKDEALSKYLEEMRTKAPQVLNLQQVLL